MGWNYINYQVGGWGEASLQGQSMCAQCYSCRIRVEMGGLPPSLSPLSPGVLAFPFSLQDLPVGACLSKSEQIWMNLSESEWVCGNQRESGVRLNESEWIWVRLNGSEHIWARLSESEWDCVKFCESERICVKLPKAEQICVRLQESVWVRANLIEIGWIWVRLSEFGLEWVDLNKSGWIWLGLSESLCVRCKTPSKTSETPPFPPISYPALAGLIGILKSNCWYSLISYCAASPPCEYFLVHVA